MKKLILTLAVALIAGMTATAQEKQTKTTECSKAKTEKMVAAKKTSDKCVQVCPEKQCAATAGCPQTPCKKDCCKKDCCKKDCCKKDCCKGCDVKDCSKAACKECKACANAPECAAKNCKECPNAKNCNGTKHCDKAAKCEKVTAVRCDKKVATKAVLSKDEVLRAREVKKVEKK